MKSCYRFIIVCILMLVTVGHVRSDDSSLALVSDNVRGNNWMMLFPADTPAIVTGSTYSWVRDGEFATDQNTLATDESGILSTEKQDSIGKPPLFDGRWVFTGSRMFSSWNDGQWASVIVDLKQPYAVAKLQLWSLVDTSCYTESLEVLTSDNGSDFTSRGVFYNRSPREAMMFVRTDALLPQPITTRYLQVRIHRLPGAYQQQIGELAIWAVKPGMSYSSQIPKPKPVDFNIQMVGSGAAKLDWSKSSVDAVAWRVYRSDKSADDLRQNAKPVVTLPGNAKNYLVYPIQPKSRTWISVSAIYNGSGDESPISEPVELVTPGIFDCNTFGDMLAINHYPNGGGAHQSRLNEQEWQIVALDMLARTPFKMGRWWRQDEYWIKQFYDRGISMLVGNDPATANPLGIYAFSAGNEPDMNGHAPDTYLKSLKEMYKNIKSANAANLVTAPTSGTEQHSLDWLDAFYKLGAKDFFDVLDIHPYCKTSGGHSVPPGIPAGAPEALLSDISKVKSIMAKYGDQNKPIIATELGYSTTIHGNPAGQITKDIQSQYIVRALVLCHVLGFKRVFWYSFFDEGTSIYDPEHNYGLVDYNMQAKPAYYSVITLGEQIGKGTLVGPVKGAKNPVYGYTYKVENEFVSVLWNGSGDSIARLAVRDPEVKVVSLLGENHQSVPTEGILRIKLSPSAVYIHSKKPISIVGIRKLAAYQERKVSISVQKDVFILSQGTTAFLRTELKNGLANSISGYTELLSSSGRILAKKQFNLKTGGQNTILLPVKAESTSPALSDYKLRVVYISDLDSAAYERKIWVRTLAKIAPGKINISRIRVPGLSEPFVVLSNSNIEISTAPGIGGRIVEIIDRKTMSNQLHMDYNQLKGLAELQWAYTYWDTINGDFKNAAYETTTKSGSAMLSTAASGLQIKKTFKLRSDGFDYNLAVTNTGMENKDITYHSHPEYNIGGTADNTEDVIMVPVKDGTARYPVWLGLGSRTHAPLNAGWYAVMDSKKKMVFGQRFDMSTIDDISIWLGESFYNMELIGKRITLQPGKTQIIKTSFFIKHGVPVTWSKP